MENKSCSWLGLDLVEIGKGVLLDVTGGGWVGRGRGM